MPVFTAATATEAAHKSHLPNSRRFLPKTPPAPPTETPTNPAKLPHDEFVCEMLIAIRDRMRECVHRMRGAPAGCDKHAAALGKLAEIERQLAGRPMPGSLKPAQPKASRSSSFVTHGEPEPEPAPAAAPDLTPPADLLG